MKPSNAQYDIIESAIQNFLPVHISSERARRAVTDFLQNRLSFTAFQLTIHNLYGKSEDVHFFIQIVDGVKVTIKTTNLSQPRLLNRWFKKKYAAHKRMLQRLQII